MSDKPQCATVRPIAGEPLRGYVASASQPNAEPYLVDLEEWNGQGQCACIRWQTVCWPCIRDTGKLPPAKRCRHIKAFREFVLNRSIQQHIESKSHAPSTKSK